MPILSVDHVTTYRYRQPVGFGEHRILFRPRDSWDQRLIAASLAITPEPQSLHWIHDAFGNCVAVARFRGRASELRFSSRITLEHTSDPPLAFALAPRAVRYPFAYDADEMPDLAPCIAHRPADRARAAEAETAGAKAAGVKAAGVKAAGAKTGNAKTAGAKTAGAKFAGTKTAGTKSVDAKAVDGWARSFLDPDGTADTRTLLAAMTTAVRRDFTYAARIEKGVQEPAETLRLRKGTCRDFALLMIEAVRSLGLAARFVSGYLSVPERDGVATHVGGGATHAWVQVYLPGAGWVEFDPTNGIVGNRDLIRVAVARDPSQAVPLHGSWIGRPEDFLDMTVTVRVTETLEQRPIALPPVAAPGL